MKKVVVYQIFTIVLTHKNFCFSTYLDATNAHTAPELNNANRSFASICLRKKITSSLSFILSSVKKAIL